MSEKNIVFKLNDNTYLYALLNKDGNLLMIKFNFLFNNDNSIIIHSQYYYEGEETWTRSYMPCFQTDNNIIIECMPFNKPNLFILIFNENLELIDRKEININNYISYSNLKCIHL